MVAMHLWNIEAFHKEKQKLYGINPNVKFCDGRTDGRLLHPYIPFASRGDNNYRFVLFNESVIIGIQTKYIYNFNKEHCIPNIPRFLRNSVRAEVVIWRWQPFTTGNGSVVRWPRGKTHGLPIRRFRVRFAGPAAGISEVLNKYFPHTWLVLVLPRIAAADLLSAEM